MVYYDRTTNTKTKLYYEKIMQDEYFNKECTIICIHIDNLNVINDIYKLNDIIDICRINNNEFIIFANKDFDLNQLKQIEVVYGFMRKNKFELVGDIVDLANMYMLQVKNRKEKKKMKDKK